MCGAHASSESERFNRDSGFELPDCWIATYKKLRNQVVYKRTLNIFHKGILCKTRNLEWNMKSIVNRLHVGTTVTLSGPVSDNRRARLKVSKVIRHIIFCPAHRPMF